MFSSEITPNYSKVGSWNSGSLNFLIGTAYIRWCQVNSHVQVVQNVYGKWGRGCLGLQKNRRPIVRSISMQPTFYIPHLNHCTPNFSGIPLEWCHYLDIQPLQKYIWHLVLFSFFLGLDGAGGVGLFQGALALLAPKVLLEDLWPMITIHPSHPNLILPTLRTTSHN